VAIAIKPIKDCLRSVGIPPPYERKSLKKLPFFRKIEEEQNFSNMLSGFAKAKMALPFLPLAL
jgi:hypothetical protein